MRPATRPGDLVAVLGVGGLGHLGVQFARRMGFETVAIARGQGKRAEALALGAHHYVDSEAEDVAERLQALGGAQVILATVTASDARSAAVGGLRPRGRMVVLGASMEDAAEGYRRTLSRADRFRVVLTTSRPAEVAA